MDGSADMTRCGRIHAGALSDRPEVIQSHAVWPSRGNGADGHHSTLTMVGFHAAQSPDTPISEHRSGTLHSDHDPVYQVVNFTFGNKAMHQLTPG
jgi:hypothetical protein